MKSSRWIILAVVVLIAVVFVYKRQSPTESAVLDNPPASSPPRPTLVDDNQVLPAEETPPLATMTEQPTDSSGGAVAAADESAPVAPAETASNPSEPAPAEPSVDIPVDEMPAQIAVRAGAELATVNGVTIKGEDLALFGADFREKAQSMSPQMYERLLNDAIDRELIRQAAKAEEVILTSDQQRQIDELAQVVKTRMESPAAGNLGYTGTIEEQTVFEQHNAECHFLLENLLERRGVNRPNLDSTDEEVDAYYREHQSQFETLSTDSEAREKQLQSIQFQIRNRLALATAGEYGAKCRELVASLKSYAHVVVSKPGK